MNKKIFFLALAAFLLSCGCSKKAKHKNELTIYSDIFPVYDFTRYISGSASEVRLITPPGADPHHFEILPADIIALNKADVFLYCGVGNAKIKNITASLSGKVLSCDVCTGVKSIDFKKSDKILKQKNHNHFALTQIDPHVWLDFENAMKMADDIYKAISASDKKNSSFYYQNNINLKKEIKALQKKYDKALSDCKITSFVHLGHFSFGYMAKRYNLKYITLQGLTPISEPSSKEIFEIIGFIRHNENIEYIFTDIFLNPRFANTIAKQTGTKILKLNPMGNLSNEDLQKNKTYFEISMENLNNLKKGLKCLK